MACGARKETRLADSDLSVLSPSPTDFTQTQGPATCLFQEAQTLKSAFLLHTEVYSFHDILCIHLTISPSSPLPVSLTLFSVSAFPSLPCK